MTSPGKTWAVAALLFGSGFCALIYQVVWLRELRLVFGASTAASAAVLAIFMGGLGSGAAVLGRWVDRRLRPLVTYATLELGITITAFASLLLIGLVRDWYAFLGGSASMGMTVATVVRLVFSALVMLLPTFLMGGTFPAAARAVTGDEDAGRRSAALLYGSNTLGAVAGAALSTFLLLEQLGVRHTLWAACIVNVLVASVAVLLGSRPAFSRALTDAEPEPAATPPSAELSVLRTSPAGFVLAAAAVVGFAFFLMELVWYRMLGPLLGGSTYTFGLILAVALLGIGIGGALFSLLSPRRPATLGGFAVCCGLEAAFMAVPLALGDGIALLAVLMGDFAALGFGGQVLSWSIIASLVILPAAICAGFQFPMLVALLGRGGRRLGGHIGQAYAFNTGGAIAGSLAGGFGLLPLLTAPGAWALVIWMLAALGACALVLAVRREGGLARPLAATGALVLALLMSLEDGPTAVWRHSGIGAGRSHFAQLTGQLTKNELRRLCHHVQLWTRWEAEGVESSVALVESDGISFIVNGKSDGHATQDASTQVMLGLISGIFHPAPRKALVVGLGTGSSAGWVAAIPTIECVDVVELEPAMVEVSRRCAPVNRNVLDNPKVRLLFTDAREVLTSTPDTYDLIASEPSNPYRAGIASLYTREFYSAVRERLAQGGIFSQWLQGYEVNAQTVRVILATLSSVFAHVETWQTNEDDLVFVCAQAPLDYDVSRLRGRIAAEPFKSALAWTWRVHDLEGFLARFVADASFAERVAREEAYRLNTDDCTLVEYWFARTVGSSQRFTVQELRETALRHGNDRPPVTGGPVDWMAVDEQHQYLYLLGGQPPLGSHLSQEQIAQISALAAIRENPGLGMTPWQGRKPRAKFFVEVYLIADALAEGGLEQPVRQAADQLRSLHPVEAELLLGHLLAKLGKIDQAVASLESAYLALRDHPWTYPLAVWRSFTLASTLAMADKNIALRLYNALKEPFSTGNFNEPRTMVLLQIALQIGQEQGLQVMSSMEPHVPWREEYLKLRHEVYSEQRHPLARIAARDLDAFRRYAGRPFESERSLRSGR
ncbi:MAG: fused MFS/spermidine synthase [Planctomycetota bacterium]